MRPRKRTNKTLPPNLYISKKGSKYYFSYRHPHTGKQSGFGSDRTKAIRAAHELNAKLLSTESDLVGKVISGGYTLDGWLDTYMEIFQSRDVADNTLRSRRCHIKAIRTALGGKDLVKLQHDVKAVADFIDEFRNQDKHRMAQAVRSALIDVFDEAKRSGYIKENPATITRAPRIKVLRSRLTLSHFNSILDKADTLDPWVTNSLLLGITTGQRLEDIANMQFKDIADNWLHVKQAKTGSLLRLSLDLRLDAIGITIGDVVSQCRDRVVSPYLIHHTRCYTKAKRGQPVHKNTVSKGFKRARDLTDLEWEHPPTFHELRSLSVRLHDKQNTNAQSLAGHKDPKTTALYIDPRGAEWIEVK